VAETTTQPAAYPKRPRFFSHRFTRLAGKACLANHLGADACWLLAWIVHTEDARGYGPVTFFNEQLLPIIGARSVDTLDRVRRRCIVAGWLHYEPGGKSRPGTYWVLIPDEQVEQDDAATDESGSDYHPDSSAPVRNKTVDTSAPMRKEAGEKPERSAERSRREAGEKCGTFFPSPIPSPFPGPKAEESPEPAPPDSGPPPADPPDPVVMEFPCAGTGEKSWHLRASKAAEYRASFPGIDLDAELRKARQWAIDNPTKRKTPGGMTRFLGRWLGNAQDEAGSRSRGPPRAQPAPTRDTIIQTRRAFIDNGRPQ
jgi:hypothetical protein